MTDAPVTYALDGNVAVIHFDDGKANVFTHAALDELQSLLTRAEADEAKAVVIIGRPGKFSAGFDLSVMTAGPDQARDLLRAGAELALRIYTFPMPVLLGVTGHALAMGAIVLDGRRRAHRRRRPVQDRAPRGRDRHAAAHVRRRVRP